MQGKKTWVDTPHHVLKMKFLEDLQDKKKIQALQNLATAKSYRQQNLVKIVAEDYKEGFLEPQERAFLDFVLSKYHLDYLNWCHRTKALKIEIAAIKAKSTKIKTTKKYQEKPKPSVIQLPLFPDMEKKPVAAVPVHILKRPSFKKWLRAS